MSPPFLLFRYESWKKSYEYIDMVMIVPSTALVII